MKVDLLGNLSLIIVGLLWGECVYIQNTRKLAKKYAIVYRCTAAY